MNQLHNLVVSSAILSLPGIGAILAYALLLRKPKVISKTALAILMGRRCVTGFLVTKMVKSLTRF